ncbi:MAG: 4Fe-4S dicluster domain-containing protein [Mariprofundaceae bacterium]
MSELKVMSYADCQGCSLCLLPCPMWRQHRDVMFSPQGIAKAMQSGATAHDVKEALSSCIMCGACDVMCPENIDLTGMIGEASQAAGVAAITLQKDHELSGFMISCDGVVQAQIESDDLYIIDAPAFHADYNNRIEHYDDLRQSTGCSMNLDLNRMAIPTGIDRVAVDQFDVQAQLRWLLLGRDFQRIIVENEIEVEALREATAKEVICVKDLLAKRGEHAAS